MAKLQFQCVHFKSPTPRDATIFFVTAFKSKHWFYRPVVERLLAAGYDVYIYDYPARPLLAAKPTEWVTFTQTLTEDIRHNIQADLRHNPATRFGIIGASVGSTLALHAAKYIPELERMLFVTLYGSSAQLVWENKQLKKIKKKFDKQNHTMQDAMKVFGPLEGTTHLELLGQRPILLFASMDDKVISYSNANRFIQAAIAHNLNFNYRIVDSRQHPVAIIRTLWDFKVWMPFFADLQNNTPAPRQPIQDKRYKTRKVRPHMKRRTHVKES